MCGRYELNATPAEIHDHFAALIPEHAWRRFTPFVSYNVAPSLACPVIRYSKRDGENVIEPLVWGFRPSWASRSWINARDDRLFTAPAFKDSAAKRRCLVIATGWYEWRTTAPPKVPYYVHLQEGRVLAFAGIWTARKLGEDEWELSFAIITTDSQGAIRRVHDRMPLVLPPERYAAWLDPSTENPAALLEPLDVAKLAMHEVSKRVNDPKNDDPTIVQPVDAAV